jgi:hypothetical protein
MEMEHTPGYISEKVPSEHPDFSFVFKERGWFKCAFGLFRHYIW